MAERDAKGYAWQRKTFGSTPNKKILVADDDEATRAILQTFLEAKGYEVLPAGDGAEALEIIQTRAPAVAILDIMMPLIDGIEVLRELRAAGSKIGVIMISAISEAEVGKRALEMGAFDHLTKPFDLKYLEDVLWWKLQMME